MKTNILSIEAERATVENTSHFAIQDENGSPVTISLDQAKSIMAFNKMLRAEHRAGIDSLPVKNQLALAEAVVRWTDPEYTETDLKPVMAELESKLQQANEKIAELEKGHDTPPSA